MGKRRRSTSSVEGLRLAIDCLPVATREAMLRGVTRHERILVGAYTDEQGGVCPMLAAHRCGGRTKFLSFAKSWDRFARAGGRNKRVASEREVRILVGQLEDSLARLSGLELDQAIAEHHVLVARGKRREAADRRDAGRHDDAGRRHDPGRRDDAGRHDDANRRGPANRPYANRGLANARRGRELGEEADPRGEIRAGRLRDRLGVRVTGRRLRRSRLAART